MFCFKIAIGLSSPESPWKPTFGFRVDEVFIGSLRMEPKPTEINTGILRSLINVSHLISNNDMELTPAQTPQINSVMIHNNTLKERVQTFNKWHGDVSSLSSCGWNCQVQWGFVNNIKLIHKVTMLYHSPRFCFSCGFILCLTQRMIWNNRLWSMLCPWQNLIFQHSRFMSLHAVWLLKSSVSKPWISEMSANST